MEIRLGINDSKLVTDDNRIHKEIDGVLAVFVENYEWIDSYKSGGWDGKIHYYNRHSGLFPTGLLSDVLYVIKKHFEIDHVPIIDERVPPVSDVSICDALVNITLRAYQTDAANRMIDNSICIVKAATNAGKTAIISEYLRRLNLFSLVIVPTLELLHQTADDLSKALGVPVGKIGDGKCDIQAITVAIPNSIVKYIKKTNGGRETKKMVINPKCLALLECEVIIYDECDTITDKRHAYLLKQLNAYYRVALSGTPLLNHKSVNHNLRGIFGDVAFEITNDELIQLGHSAKPTCYILPIHDDYIAELDYRTAYEMGIIGGDERNMAIQELSDVCASHDKGVLIIVKETAHGHILSTLIPNAVFIHGEQSTKQRRAGMDAFINRDIQVLIATTILDRGVNMPNIDVLIHAAGGKTTKRWLQRIGRSLRLGDSDEVIVIDFIDFSNENLLEHSQVRLQAVRNEKFKIKKLHKASDLLPWLRKDRTP